MAEPPNTERLTAEDLRELADQMATLQYTTSFDHGSVSVPRFGERATDRTPKVWVFRDSESTDLVVWVKT